MSQDAVEVPGRDAGPLESSDRILGVYTYRENKRASNQLAGPQLKFKGVRVGVDAERYVERLKSIPTRNIPRMKIRTRLYGVQNKGTGALVENESELVDENGQ